MDCLNPLRNPVIPAHEPESTADRVSRRWIPAYAGMTNFFNISMTKFLSVSLACVLLVLVSFFCFFLPHFLEEQDGKEKESSDTGDEDTGFHCRKNLRSGEKFSTKKIARFARDFMCAARTPTKRPQQCFIETDTYCLCACATNTCNILVGCVCDQYYQRCIYFPCN